MAMTFADVAEGVRATLAAYTHALDDGRTDDVVATFCPDGVVETIESAIDGWFAFGTQFHPESDSASALDVRIFEEFVTGITGEVVEMRMVA